MAELKAFQVTLKNSKDVAKFFFNPVISKADKRGVLSEIKAKLPGIEKFLEILVEGNRVSALDEIIEEFEQALESDSGELSVVLESARPLNEASLDEVKSMIQDRWKRKIKLTTVLKPELLGGFVARAKGRVLDASVVNQFEMLKQSLSA